MNKILTNEDFDTVIVHVGANSLANENADCVTARMKNFIYDAKKKEELLCPAQLYKGSTSLHLRF